MPEAKVLIVEDDRFLSSVLKGRLEKDGFGVLQAFDGDEGMKEIKEDGVDLVILDLIMPRMSGFEVLEQLSVDPQLSRIPVVVVSNLGQESDIERAMKLGAVEYYVKVRSSIDELSQMIKKLVAEKLGLK